MSNIFKRINPGIIQNFRKNRIGNSFVYISGSKPNIKGTGTVSAYLIIRESPVSYSKLCKNIHDWDCFTTTRLKVCVAIVLIASYFKS